MEGKIYINNRSKLYLIPFRKAPNTKDNKYLEVI